MLDRKLRFQMFWIACSWALLGGSLATRAAEGDSPEHVTTRLGNAIDNFSLDNCYGKPVSLSDFEQSPAVAIVFLGTECPLAKLYGPRLVELQQQFGQRGLQIIGINSNSQDSLTEVAAYVHRHAIEFPMLKDVGNRVADAFGAQRTPEVFLLDSRRVVRYHGRIDDQYGVGYARERDVSPELAMAVEALLEGKDIAVAETEAVGCHIGRVKHVEPTGNVTYTKDIAAIFNSRCVSCHRDGEIAPFTLTSYQDALGWEDTILEVIADKRMPPWFADPAHGSFANDARLSQRERELIETWVKNGMPEGNPSDLPPAPKFAEGWRIQQPHQVVKMRDKPFKVPAEGVVSYKHFEVDPGWDEDKYIVQTEARPDRRAVVHHILVYVIPPGADKRDPEQVLAGYAPGSLPLELTDGVAIHVAAGCKLLFEMHYTPNGTEQADLSYVGFRFTEKENVTKLLHGRIAINQRFEIPPEQANHEVRATYECKSDEDLLSMTPHMHLRGKAFRYEAIFPDGRREVLLNVPKYDFNWQLKYILEQPLRLTRGTRIVCTAVYDNSQYNLANPDPSRPVRWGDQSFEEMMIGFMDTVPAD
ncbi:MAG: redoxin domain-containing protein [Pirellulaceae bacterium]